MVDDTRTDDHADRSSAKHASRHGYHARSRAGSGRRIGLTLSERRAFQCPNCSRPDEAKEIVWSIGALLDDNGMGIRCDHVVIRWTSREVGHDKKSKKTIVEWEAETRPGCGGVLRICVHGLRVCVSCPPQFTPAEQDRTESYVPLATIAKREAAEAERRRAALKEAEKQAMAPARPAFAAPAGRVQLPFLGEAEPTKYTPPRSRRREKT